MAHFAELDENGVVMRVIVVSNSDCLDRDGQESETVGTLFCQNLLGGNWKKTSYNASIRKNYAGAGYSYDEKLDAFIPIKPFDSWVLNTLTCQWDSPVPYPNDGKFYQWNEPTKTWIEQV